MKVLAEGKKLSIRDAGPVRFGNKDEDPIIWRNLLGTPNEYNREGDRHFELLIPSQNIVEYLAENGYNVKCKFDKYNECDRFTLKVKVKPNDWGPIIYLETNGNTVKAEPKKDMELFDDICKMIDGRGLRIKSVDMDIAAYDHVSVQGPVRTAYLRQLWVVGEEDEFGRRFASDSPYIGTYDGFIDSDEDCPFEV